MQLFITVTFLVLLNIIPQRTCAKGSAKKLILSRNKAIFLPVASNANIHLESSLIVKITDLGRKIKISAKKIGSTELTIDSISYQIKVINKRHFNTFQTLQKVLIQHPTIKLQIQKGLPTINGTLDSTKLLKKLSELPSFIDGQYSFSLKITDKMKSAFVGYFKKILQQSHLPPLDFSYQPQLMALLPKESSQLKKSYELIFDHFGILIKNDLLTFSAKPLIEINVLLVEVKKGFLQQFGITPPGNIQASIVPNLSWINSNESILQIQALENRGLGKVLASPTLITSSGKLASFSSGGEIPIRTGSRSRGQVIWKKHGISLNILPTVDFNGKISLKIDTEISSIDFSTSIDGLPGINSNKLSSYVELNKSKPILLSGMIKVEKSNDTQGLPFLNRLPIIGALFSSKRFLNNKTEFVILLTPKVIKNEPTSIKTKSSGNSRLP